MTEDNTEILENKKNDNTLTIIIASIVIILAIVVIVFFLTKDKQTTVTEQKESHETTATKKIPTAPKPTINYNELEQNQDLKNTMRVRKEKYDIKNSLDMIVDFNETFKIKNYEVSMASILKQAALKRGDVVEENIGDDKTNKEIQQYGIYVVKSGDNIWNIHFNILKEYYSLQNISINNKADEPKQKGFSSGVGKILKFSEKLVIIYNLENRTIDSDINIIEPLTKIIVYNMSGIFSLLNEINYENVERLQFDGKTIWISTGE
jgi:hypothetical protein